MNATRRDQAGRMTDETVAFPQPDSATDSAGGERPAEVPRSPRYVFASGARPLEGFTIKRAIGRGGFGEVYYATSDAGKEVALKLITRHHEIERRGVLHCMNLKSPHLITIFDLRDTDEGDTFVVMEYVSGPSLASILADHPRGLPPAEVRAWLKGLVEGVTYLHEHGIVHRDLKPANLFLEDGVVKIGDYGLSKSLAGSAEAGMSENVGTCYYMAPEISRGRYHKPIDIYAIGVILYEMLTGRVPFEGETTQEVLWKHLTDQPPIEAIPEPFRAVLRRAMAKDPSLRPQSARELLPREDAPAEPDVRIIEGKPTSPPLAGANPLLGPAAAPVAPPPTRPADDVLVIGEEESVFYIGPDTRPPGARRPVRERLFGPPRHPARPRPAAPPVREAARVKPRPARPARPAPPAPRPPEPPTSRLRVAELAGSMLLAAPLAALAAALILPAYEPLGIGLPRDPLQLAYLFGMILLGTWAVLVPAKLWEPLADSRTQQRLSYLAIGAGVGAVGTALARWTFLMPSPVHLVRAHAGYVNVLDTGLRVHPAALGFVGFLALAYGANGWWKLTSRDRWRRVRFFPVAKAAALAGAIGLVCPSPQPWGVVVVATIAMLVQVVSPWNREAALYAAWRDAARRRGQAA
jgi:hypothetical protein